MSDFELQQIKRALDDQSRILNKMLEQLKEISNFTGDSVTALAGIETNTSKKR